MKKIIWHGNPGHFLGVINCRFRLCTQVNDILISTVGEWYPHTSKHEMVEIGADRKYETMVFHITGYCECGCGHPTHNGANIEMSGYNSPSEARVGHMKYVRKYSEENA